MSSLSDSEDDTFIVKEPLTVRLRNILKEYRGSIINELLQNADDAKASEVSILLDCRSHSGKFAIEDLAQYTGPAILAYNNSVFQKKDWKSLSHLGDSEKRADATSTGKFGLGFNSLYAWTDCPSILSSDYLLVLDPHERLRKEDGLCSFGGIRRKLSHWAEGNADVLKSFQGLEALRKSAAEMLGERLEGTVVRIPLRTPEQALISDISQQVATLADVQKQFDLFLCEGVENLLFMKTVEKIDFKIIQDSNVIDYACVEMTNAKETRNARHQLLAALADGTGISDSYIAEFQTTRISEASASRFLLQRNIDFTLDGLEKYASIRSESKLLPWCSIALPLDAYAQEHHGRLFVTLPLPIRTEQPVHIHASFAISPDRQHLHVTRDELHTDEIPWNTFLFDTLIPLTYARSLINSTRYVDPHDFWPAATSSDVHQQYLRRKVLESVNQLSGKIFLNLEQEWEKLSEVYVVSSSSHLASNKVLLVLKKLKISISVVQQDVFDLFSTSQFPGYAELTLAVIAKFSKNLSDLESGDRWTLLRILLVEPATLKGLELLCRADNTFAHFGDEIYSVEEEVQHIFMDRFDLLAHNVLVEMVSKIPEISIPELPLDLAVQYAHDRGISSLESSSKLIPGDDRQQYWCHKFLRFLTRYEPSKVKRAAAHLHLLVTTSGDLALTGSKAPYLVHGLGSEADEVLLGRLETASNFTFVVLQDMDLASKQLCLECNWITSQFTIEALSQYFPAPVANAFETDLCDALRDLVLRMDIVQADDILWVKSLPVFPFMNGYRTLTNNSVLPPNRFVPEKSSHAFLDPSLFSPSPQNARTLGLKIYTELEFMHVHLAPVISESSDLGAILYTARLCSAQDFKDSSYHSDILIHLRKQAWLSSTSIDGRLSKKPPAKLIVNRSGDKLSAESLFLPSEVIFLIPELQEDVLLRSFIEFLGCMGKITAEILLERIQMLHHTSLQLPSRMHYEISIRILELLDQNPSMFQDVKLLEAAQTLNWLACDDDRGIRLVPAAHSRPLQMKELLSRSYNIIDYSTRSAELLKRLEWDIPFEGLRAQLENHISHMVDDARIDNIIAILQQLAAHCQRSPELISRIKSIACIPTTGKNWYEPSRVAYDCPSSLLPYYAGVHERAQESAHLLLRMLEIPKEPTIQQLLNLLDRLSNTDTSAENATMGLVVLDELLRQSKTLPKDRSIMVPNYAGVFCDSTTLELVYCPSLPSHAHQNLSVTAAELLGMRVPGRQRLQDVLDQDDPVLEPYEQFEEMTDRIKNTLADYGHEATFREYLCNADDARATDFSLTLDMMNHEYATDGLCTDGLKSFQGPALVFYNSAVFTAHDFEAFRAVGSGSKKHNAAKIGTFGLGALAMYNWADVVLIVSGDSMLVLDPSAKFLGNRGHTPRKGFKINLKVACQSHPNQLAPFEGMCGFRFEHVAASGIFNGTIFRLPLRNESSPTVFVKHPLSIVEKCFDQWCAQQESSILFLKSVSSIKFFKRGPNLDPHKLPSQDALMPNIHSALIVQEDDTSQARSQVSSSGPQYAAVLRFSTILKTPSISIERQWAVAHYIHQLDQVPADLQDRHTTAAPHVAVAFEPETKHKQTVSGLFSYAPIADPQGIWARVPATHACFALSSDRQTIRFDETGSDATRWNDFLISIIPEAYHIAFEDSSISNKQKLSLLIRLQQGVGNRGGFLETLRSETLKKIASSTTPIWRIKTSLVPNSNLLFVAEEQHIRSMMETIFECVEYSRYVMLPRGIAKALHNSFKDFKVMTVVDFLSVIRDRSDRLQRAYERKKITSQIFKTLWACPTINAGDALEDCAIVPTCDNKLSRFAKNAVYIEATAKEKSEMFKIFKNLHLPSLISGFTFPECFSQDTSMRCGRLRPVLLGHLIREHCAEALQYDKLHQLLRTLCVLNSTSIFHTHCDDLVLLPLISPSRSATTFARASEVIWLHQNTPIFLEIFRDLPGLLVGRLTDFPTEIQAMIQPTGALDAFEFELKILERVATVNNSSSVREWLQPAADDLVWTTKATEIISLLTKNIEAVRLAPSVVKSLLLSLPLWTSRLLPGSEIIMPSASMLLSDAELKWISCKNIMKYNRTLAAINGQATIPEIDFVEIYMLPNLSRQPNNSNVYSSWIRRFERHIGLLYAGTRERGFPGSKSVRSRCGRLLRQLSLKPVVRSQTGIWTIPSLLCSSSDFFYADLYSSAPDMLSMQVPSEEQLALIGLKLRMDQEGFEKCCQYMTTSLSDNPDDLILKGKAQRCFDRLEAQVSTLYPDHQTLAGIAMCTIVPVIQAGHWWHRYYVETSTTGLSCLSRAMAFRFRGCTWSQRPIIQAPLPETLFSKLKNSNLVEPNASILLDHLWYLSSNVAPRLAEHDLIHFLDDLHETYAQLQVAQLQTQQRKSVADLHSWADKALWLNLTAAERSDPRAEMVVASRWRSAQSLLLDSDESSGALQRAEASLKPYTELLQAMGALRVSSLIPAKIIVEPDALRLRAIKLYELEETHDVTILLDCGASITAHKFMLSASSEIFSRMFHSKEFSQPSDSQNYQLPLFSRDVLQAIVYFIYYDNLECLKSPRTERTIGQAEEDRTCSSGEVQAIDDMDTLLRSLLHKAEYLQLPRLKSFIFGKIQDFKIIAPHTVEGLLVDAQAAKYPELEQECKKFIALNTKVLAQYHHAAGLSTRTATVNEEEL